MAPRPYGTVPLVIDASAWFRQRDPAVSARFPATRDADLLASCPVAAIEILAVARTEEDFAELSAALSVLPQAPVTLAVSAAALRASAELGGSRRLPAVDYLIAAAAEARGFGVLHEDRHFDTLAGVLGFPSVRLSRS